MREERHNAPASLNTRRASFGSQTLLLRSQIVLPVSRSPISDGAVLISGGRIVAVGPWTRISKHGTRNTKHVDLGDSILLPGLINAHCHLDYTDMAGMIPPQRSFTDWIKFITAAKSEWSYSEFAQSWLRGANMLLRTGTTTVADFENVPELLPEVWSATPLRVISFIELTGVRSRRDPCDILKDALDRIEQLRHEQNRIRLAPHAPYSTVSGLLKLCAETSRAHGWNMSIHVAESAQEFDMFRHGKGDLFKWLKLCQRDMSDCGRSTPIEHLHNCGALGKNVLAVHVNYLGRRDARLLAKRKVSVAHCPRSHLYFEHRKFPFTTLAKAGVNMCLGSDSLATVVKRKREFVELNMFEEMRAFSRANRRVSAKTIVEMATINGARAIGLSREVGELSKGALADLIAIPAKANARNAYDAVLEHSGDVVGSMIAGRWAVGPT